MKPWEKNIAALTHLLAILPLWGLIIIGIIWLRYKEESRAVVFHALQAIFFQITFLLFVIIFIIFQLFCSVIAVINPPLAELLITINGHLLKYGLAPLFVIGCLIATLSVLFGKDFQYPLIGERLKRELK